MDADTMVLQNIDDLFEREEFSAAPDPGWPDCFNSGVFVFKPSLDTYKSLLQFAISQGSFDGGDQGLLNLYFSEWARTDIKKHLPFLYNVVSQAFYSYAPAFKQFGDKIKVVHFIGECKPWSHHYCVDTKTVTSTPGSGHDQKFLQMWWNLFVEKVSPQLTHFGDIQYQLENLSIGCGAGGSGGVHTVVTDAERFERWERGHVDYLGADAFSNIEGKLNFVVGATVPLESTSSVQPEAPAVAAQAAKLPPKANGPKLPHQK